MNDSRTTDDDRLALIDMQAIHDWLAAPQPAQAEDQLAPLHAHLAALRDLRTDAGQRETLLDLLGARIRHVIDRLMPGLVGVTLPLSRRTRHTVRSLQGMLLTFAEEYLRLLDAPASADRNLSRERIAWRALDALGRHLLIGSHVAAPYAPGIWKLVHRIYRAAASGGYAGTHLPEAEGTIADTYLQTCLLACAQPASFTSREIALVTEYIRRFSSRAAFLHGNEANEAEGVFWIDPDRDAPPVSAGRRPPPEGAIRFACERLAQLAEEQVEALEAGASAADLDLPETAITPAGHGVLRRLAHHWGHPGKRRFPRRRQNYPAQLCIGLSALNRLFGRSAADGEKTDWLVTNESPDGYALMHSAGKTGRLAAGEVVAIRTENHADWQTCIVRWVLSENPEHLELGLQILSRNALPATVVVPGEREGGERRRALLLPALPPIRDHETLVAPVGTMLAGERLMALLIERDNLEVRRIRPTRVEEQTASIEVIAFETEDAS